MSRPPRFFITPDQVREGRVSIIGEDVLHIATVLRKKTGDELLVCDGQGTEYRVRIESAGKQEVVAGVLGISRREIAGPRVTLGQGIAKADKMDWIVQKATELGVTSLVPLVTERTIVKIQDETKRVSRWQKIAREAAMQSDRPDIPKVWPVHTYKDLLHAVNGPTPLTPPLPRGDMGGALRFPPSPDPSTLLLLPWEEAAEPIKNIFVKNADVQNIVVLIGPEGGFSKAEAGLAKEKGFHPVSLGPFILRTETAAIAALSMVSYAYRSRPDLAELR